MNIINTQVTKARYGYKLTLIGKKNNIIGVLYFPTEEEANSFVFWMGFNENNQ